jgi:two-component system cell cycle response regulator DivK
MRQRSQFLRHRRGRWRDSYTCVRDSNREQSRVSTPAKNRTVLLVEDNEDNLIIYSTILRHAGLEVVEARDGEAGIAMALAHHPAVILMDVSIPLIDGWEATRRLKANPQTADIPIIALTAHALATDREKAIDAGCDGYIPKPAEPRVVLTAVQRYIDAVAVA